MKNLNEHNTERTQMEFNKHEAAGVSCPKCGEELRKFGRATAAMPGGLVKLDADLVRCSCGYEGRKKW